MTLRETAEASLLRERTPRPTLLMVGIYLAPAFGGMCLLAVVAAALNTSFVRFTVNGDVVTGHEFLKTAGLALTVLGALALGIAYGIWQERPWTRWLILGFWATVVALDVGLGWAQAGLGGAASAVATLAVVLLLVGWYLFGKENVVEYFRALEHAARTRTGP